MFKNPLYVYGNSHDLKLPAKLNFGEFMLNNLWIKKEKFVMMDGLTGEAATCGRIAQEAMSLAISLSEVGVRKGDVVAICTENRMEFWATVIGVACTGAVITLINPGYSKLEFNHVMNISKPKYIVFSPKSYGVYAQLLESYKHVDNIIIYGEERQKNCLSYNKLAGIANGKLERKVQLEEFEAVDVRGQTDTLFILYSSGTTGLSKGIMLTHLNIMAACILPATLDPDAINVTIAPWFHTMGLTGTLRCLTNASSTVFLAKFDVDTYLKIIEKYKAKQLILSPPVLVALCKYHSDHDVSSVNLIFSGAAPLHGETIEAVRKRFPNLTAVLQGYGMTETTLAITRDTYERTRTVKQGGVGYVVQGYDVKIVDLETRKPLGPNQPGELCVKGVMIMKGYAGNDSNDDFDEEGFFKTGDVGYYDQDQCFFIVDRLKELIKYKGYQVAPAELEALLLEHPGVRDAGVVGIPDEEAGELPLAYVVSQPGAVPTEAELQKFVADRLSNPKRLRGGVRFVQEIPKNPSGKILRKVLREMTKKTISRL